MIKGTNNTGRLYSNIDTECMSLGKKYNVNKRLKLLQLVGCVGKQDLELRGDATRRI